MRIKNMAEQEQKNGGNPMLLQTGDDQKGIISLNSEITKRLETHNVNLPSAIHQLSRCLDGGIPELGLRSQCNEAEFTGKISRARK
jgi:hypothetical protein